MTKEELETYVRSLCKEKNYSQEDTDKAVALAVGSDETARILGPIIDLPLGRQADAARTYQGLQAYKLKLAKWRDEEIKPALTAAEDRAKKAEEKALKLEAKYGKLDDSEDLGDGTSRTPSGDIVDTKKLEDVKAAIKQETSRDFLAVQLDTDRITRAHFERTGKLPDITQLWGLIANPPTDANGRPVAITNLDEAYNHVHGADIKASAEKAHSDEIAAAEKRGAENLRKELLARGGSPRDLGASMRESESGMFGPPPKEGDKPLSDDERLSSFAMDLSNESLAGSAAG